MDIGSMGAGLSSHHVPQTRSRGETAALRVNPSLLMMSLELRYGRRTALVSNLVARSLASLLAGKGVLDELSMSKKTKS